MQPVTFVHDCDCLHFFQRLGFAIPLHDVVYKEMDGPKGAYDVFSESEGRTRDEEPWSTNSKPERQVEHRDKHLPPVLESPASTGPKQSVSFFVGV